MTSAELSSRDDASASVGGGRRGRIRRRERRGGEGGVGEVGAEGEGGEGHFYGIDRVSGRILAEREANVRDWRQLRVICGGC